MAAPPKNTSMSAHAANQKYTEYRWAACDFVLETYEQSIFIGDLAPLAEGLEFRPIDDEAIAAYTTTAINWQFDWVEWYRHFRSNPLRALHKIVENRGGHGHRTLQGTSASGGSSIDTLRLAFKSAAPQT